MFDLQRCHIIREPREVDRMFNYEIDAAQTGYLCVAGVDEAGRGPLAGPVVASAVVLESEKGLDGLTDSKKLSQSAREKYFPLIQSLSRGYGIGVVAENTIDEINILQASLLAMKIAVEKIDLPVDYLLIDGNQTVNSKIKQKTIVGGDSLSLSIAAASVLAKVTRDRLMESYHDKYPHYMFDRHKGYGTRLHREKISEYGPCPIHRKTFKGVREFL
ncbi:MAG: ribonuclease HII [Nitrospinales bacterium]